MIYSSICIQRRQKLSSKKSWQRKLFSLLQKLNITSSVALKRRNQRGGEARGGLAPTFFFFFFWQSSLFIEIGRYSKPPAPIEKHLCNFCKQLFLEDEKPLNCIVRKMTNVDWTIMIHLMWTCKQMSIPLKNVSILKTLQLIENVLFFFSKKLFQR